MGVLCCPICGNDGPCEHDPDGALTIKVAVCPRCQKLVRYMRWHRCRKTEQ